MHRDSLSGPKRPTTFVERAILAAARRDEHVRQRIRSKPLSQRSAVEAIGDIVHHPELRLAFASGFAS